MRTDLDEAQAELSKILANEIQVNQANLVAKMQIEQLTSATLTSLYLLNLNKIRPLSRAVTLCLQETLVVWWACN